MPEDTPQKKAPQGKPSAKKPPAKKTPLGPFGKAFLQNLKTAPHGTADEALIMQTLHSVPVEQLKAALAKGTPKERSLLFSVLPRDQIKSILASLPASVLAPAVPLAPPPSPTGGPPASILQTTYVNDVYPPAETDPNWSEKISNGSTIGLTSPPPWEWVSVYDPTLEKEGSLNNPMVGLTGWVVSNRPPLSQGDVWFVHPFGFDFEFYIVPDPQYESLLASSNTGVTPGTGAKDTDYSDANTNAHNLGLTAPKGVIGVETDQGLVPSSFQNLLTDGTRIATFGRWIVDCGHDDFHTEIHAPLLMAVAKPASPPAGVSGASEMTSVQIMSRPYTVSQQFAEGNFIDHLLAEVVKVEPRFSASRSRLASKRTRPYSLPRTTGGRSSSCWSNRRRESSHISRIPAPAADGQLPLHAPTGVAVQVFDAGNGTVGIIVVLGDLNPAPLPPKHDLTVQWGQLGSRLSLRDRSLSRSWTSSTWTSLLRSSSIAASSPTSMTLRAPRVLSTTRTSPRPVGIDQLQPMGRPL